MHVLLVEDDAMVSSGIAQALRRHDFTVSAVETGAEALVNIKTENLDIVILDLGLPDIDGIDLMKKLRQLKPDMPVLILTARDGLPNKVLGLDAGADDYLTKPFEIEELMARLRVLERRLGGAHSSEIVIGKVCLSTTGHWVKVENNEIDLTRREFMLLKALMESVGSIITKDTLESRLYSLGEEVGSNTIEVHIHHLRKKLPPDFIQTVRGIGYVVKR